VPKLTEEQISQARSVDLLRYLQIHEPDNVRKSKGSRGEYYYAPCDSLKISNGKWFRHSTQYGGYSALDFLMKVRGVHFVDAVQSLTGGYMFADYKAVPKPQLQLSKPKIFTLPTPNRNNDRVVAYLRERGINKDVIYGCIKASLLYESDKHHCVFIGKDENGTARFACERGVTDDLKKDVYGSSKQYSFVIPPKEPNGHGKIATVSYAENPIISRRAFTSIRMQSAIGLSRTTSRQSFPSLWSATALDAYAIMTLGIVVHHFCWQMAYR